MARYELTVNNKTATLRDYAKPLAELKSNEVRGMAAYWQSKRTPSGWCLKSAIDPVEIKPLLPQIVIAEISRDPLRIYYRLVGTGIAAFYGDFTGTWLHDRHVTKEYRDDAELFYQILVDTREPICGISEYPVEHGLRLFEFGFFPLTVNERDVTHAVFIEQQQKNWLEVTQPVTSAD